MSLIPGVRIDPRLRIDPWIGSTPDVSSGLLKCTRSGTTAKLLRMMDLTARIRHNSLLPDTKQSESYIDTINLVKNNKNLDHM